MRYLFFVLLFISVNAFSQCKQYIIGVKGDTLNCIDKNDRKQGRWVVHVDNLRGERGYEEEGVYMNNKKEGTWRKFSLEGDLIAVENYRWGNKNGENVYLEPGGNPIRIENWKAVNPDNPYDTVDVYDPTDPTLVVERRVVKLDGFSLKHGTWKYYDTFKGTVEKTEEWFLDKPVVHESAVDDDLAPIAVTDNDEGTKKKVPKPKEVLEFEKKNSGKKSIRVRDGATF